MSVHAGIVVKKQITNEKQWFEAMKHIQQEFIEKDYFEVLPHFNIEEYNNVTMKKFNLDEYMNFSRNGFQGIDNWREFPFEKNLTMLKDELNELRKMSAEAIDKGKRQYFGIHSQKKLENLAKAVEYLENCDDDDEELFQEILKRKVSLRRG